MVIKERRHRLPKDYYKGDVTASFTLCIKGTVNVLSDPEIVQAFTGILAGCADKTECIVPVFCFMPDHQHLIMSGKNKRSDIYKGVVTYKQRTGYWMSKKKPEMKWQKDFYDHIIRKPAEIAVQIRYILDNPVRNGLVSLWRDYPFQGSIGCKVEDVLSGIM